MRLRNDVIVVGDAYIDFVFQNKGKYPYSGEEIIVQGYELRPGGSAGYTAIALASLGLRVSIVSNVGDDFLSKYWLDFLSKLGIDVRFVKVIKRAQIGAGVVFLHKTDRSFITFRGANEIRNEIDIEKYIDSYEGAEFLLITGFSQAPYLWNTIFAESIMKIKKKGITIALDTNWSIGEWVETCKKLMPYVDYLMINDIELTKLVDENDLYQAGQNLLNKGVGMCIIKRGKLGSTIIKKECMQRVPTNGIEPTDLNAAGDFFNAGFIYSCINKRAKITSCRFANECAKCAISRFEIADKLQELRLLKEWWKNDK